MCILHFYEQIICDYVIISAQRRQKPLHLIFLTIQKKLKNTNED